jgi:6-pyruvoyltetrahydropterin/6-carboxytetrahydropterin synthase
MLAILIIGQDIGLITQREINMGKYITTKTYDHNAGLTCAWRNWKAKSKARFLHGYSLHVKIVLAVTMLDETGRALDLDDMEEIDSWLKETFSHTTCIAEDDPRLTDFQRLHSYGVIDLRIMSGVGMERFAETIWHRVRGWLCERDLESRVSVRTVEVMKHPANSGLYLD